MFQLTPFLNFIWFVSREETTGSSLYTRFVQERANDIILVEQIEEVGIFVMIATLLGCTLT